MSELTADDERHDRAAEELSRRYWPAVYAYLRRSGRDREQAEELTQAFFSEVVLGRQLLEQGDPKLGRLRALILTAVKRFVIDADRQRRSRRVQARARLDTLDHEESQWNGSSLDGPSAFERRWAVAQLEEAMRRC